MQNILYLSYIVLIRVTFCLLPDLNSDLVIQYLNENPEFLENYVLNHVNQERLQRWTAWKEQVRRQRHGENLNGKFSLCKINT